MHPNFSCGLRRRKRPISSFPSSCGTLRGNSYCCCLGYRPAPALCTSPGPPPPPHQCLSQPDTQNYTGWGHSHPERTPAHPYLCRETGGRGLPVESSPGSSVPFHSGCPSGACRGPSSVAWLSRELLSRSPYRNGGDNLVRPARAAEQEDNWGV